jgi:hypothetical protein
MKLKGVQIGLLSGALLFFLSAVVMDGMVNVAAADHFSRRSDYYRRSEMREFREFLRDHPKIARDLERNPNLVNNPRYLDDRPQLRHFLRRNPTVRSEILSRPGIVFGRYGGWNNDRGPWGWGWR